MGAPIAIWNQIAPQMQSEQLRRIFSIKNQEKADSELDAWARKKMGKDVTLTLAYQEIAPLLIENQAIGRWVERNPEWLQAMPEVLTPGEAALLAQADYMLSAMQTRRLIEQLKQPSN